MPRKTINSDELDVPKGPISSITVASRLLRISPASGYRYAKAGTFPCRVKHVGGRVIDGEVIGGRWLVFNDGPDGLRATLDAQAGAFPCRVKHVGGRVIDGEVIGGRWVVSNDGPDGLRATLALS